MKLLKSMNIYTEEVTHRFREQEPTKQVYKRVFKDIHTETVRKPIQQYSENHVLGQAYKGVLQGVLRSILMKLNSQESPGQDSPNSGVASKDSLIPTSTD